MEHLLFLCIATGGGGHHNGGGQGRGQEGSGT